MGFIKLEIMVSSNNAVVLNWPYKEAHEAFAQLFFCVTLYGLIFKTTVVFNESIVSGFMKLVSLCA
jgi:hypothetical protein